jgi:hypothetical protein
VFTEQDALSENIFNVRENAHKIPQCKKGPAGKERFFPEKGGIFPEKWPRMPEKILNLQD